MMNLVTDPNQPEPFAPPYVLNESSVTIQNGEEVWPNSAPPPRPPRQRPWLVPVVIVGVLALVGGLVGAAVAEFQAIGDRVAAVGSDSNDTVPQPINVPTQAPPRPTPTALSGTCDSGCLDLDSSGLMVPNNSLLTSMPLKALAVSPDFQHPSSVGLEYQADSLSWATKPSAPDPCFLVSTRSPIGPTLGGPDSTSSDAVTYLGTTSDDSAGTQMTQTARFFPTPAAATAYMRNVREQLPACQSADHSVKSTPSFAIADPMDINAFAQISARSTTYVYDIQRANAVVRFRVVSTDGVDEPGIVHFLNTWVTTDLAQLDLN